MTWSRADTARVHALIDGFGLQARDMIRSGDWRAFWEQRVAAPDNLRRLIVEELTNWLKLLDVRVFEARLRTAEIRATHELDVASGKLLGTRISSSLDRVVWHEKHTAKDVSKLSVTRKLLAKIHAGEMPPECLQYRPLTK